VSKLIYSSMMSLDGFTADESGNFDWAAPDEEVHAFVNDRERPIGTYLYGRRMYEVMSVWDSPDMTVDEPPVIVDYAQIWRAADKVVYSTTLEAVMTARTRVERVFDPEDVAKLKKEADADLGVGGPELAGQMLRAGLVDECSFYLAPVLVGGGTRALPRGYHAELELLEQHTFANGVVYVRYRTKN